MTGARFCRRSFASLVSASALCACSASSTPQSDLRFGHSLRTIQSGQTLFPQGAASMTHTPEMAGAVAVLVQQQYLQSFESRERGSTPQIREQMK